MTRRTENGRTDSGCPMPDFWRSSGYHLLDVSRDGRLVVSADFLCAYLARPELAPLEESCAEELALHDALRADPHQDVPAARLERLADPDARENYAAFLRFRDRLLASPTLEAAYLDLIRNGLAGVPPLCVDHLVHAVLRHILDGCNDPLTVRAAELLFREQKVTIQDGAIMLADEETIEMQAQAAGFESLGRLLVDQGAPSRTVDLDVLDEANAALYWPRSDRFDTVLDIGFTRPGLDGLCRVLEAWVRHLTGAATTIQPVQQIRDERWIWHVGLDAEASAILNDLYDGREVDEARLAQLLTLFRLTFRAPDDVQPHVRGRPVYLGLAMTPEQRVRLKPQNLLINLPLGKAT